MVRVKRLGRYLKNQPRFVLQFKYQEGCDNITVWTDTDFAGCVKTRKSTSGGVVQLGGHTIRTWSTHQSVIALSSGEAEYYGMVKGASVGLGVRALMEDLGWEYSGSIELRTDASAAIGIANRVGVGKVRHIEVSQLWLQHKVASKDIVVIKVEGGSNIADALTKPLDANNLRAHISGVGAVVREDRHEMAPREEGQDDANTKCEEYRGQY